MKKYLILLLLSLLLSACTTETSKTKTTDTTQTLETTMTTTEEAAHKKVANDSVKTIKMMPQSLILADEIGLTVDKAEISTTVDSQRMLKLSFKISNGHPKPTDLAQLKVGFSFEQKIELKDLRGTDGTLMAPDPKAEAEMLANVIPQQNTIEFHLYRILNSDYPVEFTITQLGEVLETLEIPVT